LQRRHDVTAPRRPLGHYLVEQVELGEAHRRRPPPTQHRSVRHRHHGDRAEQPESIGMHQLEIHR